ncbi:MAG TPA: type III pantothenate kinase [Turneriella sp.]|nr:type III pantothenate kinase [Turneriella sp.]
MTLTIDVGNSHTVVGFWREHALVHTLRLASDARRTADEWRLMLLQALRENSFSQISKASLCSVVPAARLALNEAVRQLGVTEPLWLSSTTPLNFTFAYPQPQMLGADRLADMIAARHYFGTNCITIDFGTAVTFSVLTDGEFVGGVIAPGITSSLEALFSATAKLPQIAFRRTQNAVGQSTVESIEIGAYFGWRGMVREILTEIKRELPEHGKNHCLVATGGIVENIEFAPDFFDVVDKNLTLKGLYLALQNAKAVHD